jgi:hypothetical protein
MYAGYAPVLEFDELKDFLNEAEEVLRKPEPILVCVKTVPDIRAPRQPGGPVNPEVVRGRPQAIANLLREFGQSPTAQPLTFLILHLIQTNSVAWLKSVA